MQSGTLKQEFYKEVLRTLDMWMKKLAAIYAVLVRLGLTSRTFAVTLRGKQHFLHLCLGRSLRHTMLWSSKTGAQALLLHFSGTIHFMCFDLGLHATSSQVVWSFCAWRPSTTIQLHQVSHLPLRKDWAEHGRISACGVRWREKNLLALEALARKSCILQLGLPFLSSGARVLTQFCCWSIWCFSAVSRSTSWEKLSCWDLSSWGASRDWHFKRFTGMAFGCQRDVENKFLRWRMVFARRIAV